MLTAQRCQLCDGHMGEIRGRDTEELTGIFGCLHCDSVCEIPSGLCRACHKANKRDVKPRG